MNTFSLYLAALFLFIFNNVLAETINIPSKNTLSVVEINADNQKGEYIRYIPNIFEGKYKVQFFGAPYKNELLLSRTNHFYVIVKHRDGKDKIKVELSKSTEIGMFNFYKGREGYIEIISDDSNGIIIADALLFEKVD